MRFLFVLFMRLITAAFMIGSACVSLFTCGQIENGLTLFPALLYMIGAAALFGVGLLFYAAAEYVNEKRKEAKKWNFTRLMNLEI